MEDCTLLQRDLTTLHQWSNKWKLFFNVNKFKVMSFTGAGNYQFEYDLNNGILEYVYFNDLCLIVTDNLS